MRRFVAYSSFFHSKRLTQSGDFLEECFESMFQYRLSLNSAMYKSRHS